MLDVRTETVDAAVVVWVHGEVDLNTEAQLTQALRGAVAGQQADELVVDLAGVPFLDSSGVRALLQARAAAAERGMSMRVRNPQDLVAQVLRVTLVAELFGVASR
ncbi:MAG TPA: STAS domain-containing protein [Micromonosporaceae bacterium]|nr:STAS domain-containing protein [Micromonosporaceae bacterium]